MSRTMLVSMSARTNGLTEAQTGANPYGSGVPPTHALRRAIHASIGKTIGKVSGSES
jgi:hypothetical protein